MAERSCVTVWDKNRNGMGRWRFHHDRVSDRLRITITSPDGAHSGVMIIPGMTPERMEAWAALRLVRSRPWTNSGILTYYDEETKATVKLSARMVEVSPKLGDWDMMGLLNESTLVPSNKDAIFWGQFAAHLRKLARAVRAGAKEDLKL